MLDNRIKAHLQQGCEVNISQNKHSGKISGSFPLMAFGYSKDSFLSLLQRTSAEW